MSGGFVYFARRTDGTGPIKIGCSSAPSVRLRQLEIDMQIKVTVLAEAPGDFILERNLHIKFAYLNEAIAHRADRATPLSGATEWFTAAPELLAFIEGVARTGCIELDIGECREKLIAARYLAGETLQAIGTDFNLTRERVRQILRAAGVPSLGFRPFVGRVQARTKEMSDHVVALTKRGRTVVEISRATGLSPVTVRRVLMFRGQAEAPAKKGGQFKPEITARAKEIVRDYASGVKLVDILRKHSVTPPEVYRSLKRFGNGVQRRRPANARAA